MYWYVPVNVLSTAKCDPTTHITLPQYPVKPPKPPP